jgi:hypothetical protein
MPDSSTAYIIYDIPQGKAPQARREPLGSLADAMTAVGQNWRGFVIRQDETDRVITREIAARA